MKIFNKLIMVSENEPSKLKDGYFMNGTADAEVEDGAFVSIKGPRTHELYSTMKDLNARIITAYDASAPIYGFVDYVGVSHGEILGVSYRMGDKLVGTHPAAGEGTRVRIPEKGDEFFLGDENFSGTPAVGKFGVPEAGKTTLKIEATAPASGFYVELEDSRDLIMGQVNEGSKMYRCRVMA